MEIDADIGRRLRARRHLLGLTLQNVGDASGVSFQMLHKYETGRARLSAAVVWSLARALGVDVNYLFGQAALQESEPVTRRPGRGPGAGSARPRAGGAV